MRYRVHAAFDTEAREVVLAPSPTSKRAALLVAGGCVVELSVAAVAATTGAASGAPLSADAAPCRLTVLPWESGRLRVCVNGISYGTGPLVLRDGDELTLRPSSVAGGGTAAAAMPTPPYTYRIQAIPEPAPETPCQSAVEHAGADAREDNMRLQVMLTNLDTYATWNNFYSDRFGNLATVRLVQCPGVGATTSSPSTHQLHQCTCGCYVQSRLEKVPSGSSGMLHIERGEEDAATTTVGLPAGPARTLITLLPSIPELLAAGTGAPSTAPPGAEYAPAASVPWTCCHCPFIPASADPARRRCVSRGVAAAAAAPTAPAPTTPSAAGLPSTTEATTQAPPAAAPSQEKKRKAKVADVSASSGDATAPTAWASYSRMRHDDWEDKATGAAVKVEASASGGAEPGRRLDADRSTVELFNRICSMESALMGCRYE